MRSFQLPLVASFVLSSLALAAPSAHAECSSVDSCQQALKCVGGFSLKTHPSIPHASYCADVTPAATVEPICTTFRDNSDWVFDKTARDCTRTRENGVVVHLRDNLACPSGTTALPMPGGTPVACQRAEKTEYSAPRLAAPGGSIRPEANASSLNAALRVLYCTVGSVKKTGDNFFCELHLASARTEEPICSDFGGKKWTWDGGKKACTRKDAGGATLTNTQNVECRKPATLTAGGSSCVTPKGTYYDEPGLTTL